MAKITKFMSILATALALLFSISCSDSKNEDEDDDDDFKENIVLGFDAYGKHLDGIYNATFEDLLNKKTLPGYLFFEFYTGDNGPTLWFGGYELEDAEEEIGLEFKVYGDEEGNPFRGDLLYIKMDYSEETDSPGRIYSAKGYFKGAEDFEFEFEHKMTWNAGTDDEETYHQKWNVTPR